MYGETVKCMQIVPKVVLPPAHVPDPHILLGPVSASVYKSYDVNTML